MPDGYSNIPLPAQGGSSIPFFTGSRAFGEQEQRTDVSPLMAPFGGANPMQIHQMLSSPGVQKQLAAYGLAYHPELLQQSPFFSNHFMQGHPNLGSRLSSAMSNLAMTPGPQGPEGAGSGIQRMMQGAAAGPQMQRQFQTGQMMAPMQAMGMMVPGMEAQQRQQFGQALIKDIGAQQDINQQRAQLASDITAFNEQEKQAADARQQQDLERKSQEDALRYEQAKPIFGPAGTGYATYNPPQPPPQMAPAQGGPAWPPPQGGTPGGFQMHPYRQDPNMPGPNQRATPGQGMTPAQMELHRNEATTGKAKSYEAIKSNYALGGPNNQTDAQLAQKGYNPQQIKAYRDNVQNNMYQDMQDLENRYAQDMWNYGLPNYQPPTPYPGQQAARQQQYNQPNAFNPGAGQQPNLPPIQMFQGQQPGIYDLNGKQYIWDGQNVQPYSGTQQ